MKKHFNILLVLLLTFSLGSCSGKIDSSKNVEITIIHFNDFHSKIKEFRTSRKDKNKSAGISRVVALIKQLKKQNKNSIVMMAGDMIQGSPFSTLKKGSVSFSLFNNVIDYLVVGNHEFDYGLKNLNHLVKSAGFKTITSNVYYKNSNQPLTKYRQDIINMQGIKVGIFGLTTTTTPETTLPANVVKLRFEDEITTANNMVKNLKAAKCNVIIALTHLGFDRDKILANKVKGINVIIGGHSHTKVEKGQMVNNTMVAQARHNGEYLGVVKITYNTGVKKIVKIQAKLVKVTHDIEKDAVTLKSVKQIEKVVMSGLDKRVGISKTDLISTRKAESNIGDLIADIIKKRSNVDVALVNSGGIRANILKGTVKHVHVLKVLPFGNTISVFNMKGKNLLKVFEKSATKVGAGAFMQVSRGVKYIVKNNKLVSVKINGKDIEPNKTYKIATSNFLASGGDGYSEFKAVANKVDTGNLISTAVTNYFKMKKIINVVKAGRIKIE